jgi:hypothetical protein
MSSFIKSGMLRKPSTAATYEPVTGAAPQTVNGNTLSTMQPHASSGLAIAPGSLSALVVARITTNLLTITGKWQVSAGGASPTWYDVGVAQNAANVAIATGTGSIVTTNKVISAPEACYGWLYARFVLTSGAAVGGGADVDDVAISYSYRLAEP